MRPKKRSASKPRAGRRTAGAASSVFTSCLSTAQVEVFPGSRVPVLRVDGGNLSRSFNRPFPRRKNQLLLTAQVSLVVPEPWETSDSRHLPSLGPEDILDKLHSQEDAALLPEQQKAMPCIPRYFVEFDVFRVCFGCVTWQNCLWMFTGTS